MDLNQGHWCDCCHQNLYGNYKKVWNPEWVGWLYFCSDECHEKFFK
jgi:hypothetical protein